MAKKISIDYIASWRSGEMITEQKLNEVFSLIGKVINLQAADIDLIVKNLNEMHLATRWVGTVEKYNDIEKFIAENKNKPEFLPPNKPLPSSGDVIFVNNNSDDVNLPPDINAGRYIYIYQQDLEGKNGKWELYNPFKLVNASPYNDGLMSKEDKIKLDGIPTGDEINTNFDNCNQQINLIKDNLAELNPQVQTNTDIISNLQPLVNSLSASKQDRNTDIPNYKTKNVEDNLQEVKELVDFINPKNLLIWEAVGDNGKVPITGGTNTITATFNITGKELEVSTFIKVYGVLVDTTNNISIDIVDIFKVDTMNKMVSLGTIKVADTFINYSATLQYNPNTITITYLFSQAIPTSSRYVLNFSKIIKDVGLGDATWSDKLKQEIIKMLQNTLGIKNQLIFTNHKETGFDGFRKGDEFKTSFKYISGANAVEVFIGGTKTTKGIEWEEVSSANGLEANKIRFLRDINIEREGAIEIKAVAIVNSTFSFGIWDETTKWLRGDIVIDENNLYYAKKDNIGIKPSTDTNSVYWVLLDIGVDLSSIKQELIEYINQVAKKLVDEVIESYKQLEIVVDGKGELKEFETQEDFEAFKLANNIDDSYFKDVNDKSIERIVIGNGKDDVIGMLNVPKSNFNDSSYIYNFVDKYVEYTDKLKEIVGEEEYNKYQIENVEYQIWDKELNLFKLIGENAGGEKQGVYELMLQTNFNCFSLTDTFNIPTCLNLVQYLASTPPADVIPFAAYYNYVSITLNGANFNNKNIYFRQREMKLYFRYILTFKKTNTKARWLPTKEEAKKFYEDEIRKIKELNNA